MDLRVTNLRVTEAHIADAPRIADAKPIDPPTSAGAKELATRGPHRGTRTNTEEEQTMAQADLERELSSLKKELAKLQSDMGKLAEDSSSAAKQAASTAQEAAAAAYEKLEGEAKQLFASAKSAGQGAVKTGEDAVAGVERTIREHPLASAAVALGAGFVLGSLLSRRS